MSHKVRIKIMDEVICFVVPYSIFIKIKTNLECSHRSSGRDIDKLFAGLNFKEGKLIYKIKKNKNRDFLKFAWH